MGVLVKLIAADQRIHRFSKFNYAFLTLAIGAVFIAALVFGSQVRRPLGSPPIPGDPSDRYQVHITTDKPIYRSGEKLYVRGVVLRATDHSPMSAGGTANFEIKGPKGDIVTSGAASILDSVAGFSWEIPAGQAGGEYTVRIRHASSSPAERKFDIRTYRAPRLKSQIVFVRDGYGPGDTVAASLHVERAEGGVPANAKVSIAARVDGQETWRGDTKVDGSGNAGASFKLPATIARGEGVLVMTIQDGGSVETATKTIPILLQTVDLAMYPEGGDLIAGLPTRVYFEGRTPAQKPADLAGIVLNRAGKEVATFRSEHDGRGRFFLTPAKGEAYSLRVKEPAGIQKLFPLPAVKDAGAVISSIADVVPRLEDVVVRVAATERGAYDVVLTAHGKEFSSKRVSLTANQPAEVAFTVPRVLDGVIVATIYDAQNTPLAERLVFRQPEHHLNVQVTADRTDYVPGDKVNLRITTTDDNGKPVGAMVGLTVTDSSVLEMIEKREQAPRLPVMVLLENDVQNLADAHVYLDESNPKAPLATDLLLGTQGWRRFLYSGTGALNGVITDVTGAAIPGVTVHVVNQETGAVLERATDERGGYAFPDLSSGTYQVNAALPGFRTETASDVRVKFRSNVRQDLRLTVGSVAEEVRVMAARPMNFRVGGVLGGVLPAAAPIENERIRDVAVFDEKAAFKFDAAPQPADDFRQQRGQQGQRFGIGLARDAAKKEVFVNTVTVREYAHALQPNWTAGSRQDFTETVYWNAGIKTDLSTGVGTVSFQLSDSVTAFRVLADGFGRDGALGSGISHIESVQPFSIEPKLPLQITSGDVIQLPVSIVNGTSRELRNADVAANGAPALKFSMLGDTSSVLRAKERARRLLQIEVGEFSGATNLTFDGKAGLYRDTVRRTLDVQSPGFLHETSTGGMLERNGAKSFEFTLPAEMIRGSIASSITVYPTPLASMTDALQSLLQQPYGCFEQTSSTSYPITMAQQYFLSHNGVDPAIVEKARDLLEVSYKKLTGFESRSKGYEWFGADPGHEALTAYGLMQFTDMAKVRSVDKEMLDRTRNWLLSRRDGKGGFSMNPRALDSFGRAPADTTNAYIVWALTESGMKGLDKEIAAVKASAAAMQDSYVLALAANILSAAGDQPGARQLMDKLAKSQNAAGTVNGAVTSITRSGGDALAIETTALSVLAWMREPSYTVNVEKGLKWIVESNKSGRFGSTQSTILALRAIVAYDAAHARPKAPGRLILSVDGKEIGAPLAFAADTKGALVLPDFASKLAPGKHSVVLKMDDGSSMPFAIGVKYNSTLPDSSAQAQVGIEVRLRDTQIQEGNITEAVVSITNKSDQVIPTPVAIVGIPGGLEVRHDQLKELVKSGKIDTYEVRGREVILYWRVLKARDKFDLPLSLVAAIPGSYSGPASRAYLYYTDELKNWAPGLKVNITPR